MMRKRKTTGAKNLQKGFVLLLTAVLLMTMLPLAGLAAGQKSPGNAPAFLSSFTAHAASNPTSGECGDSAKWSFNKKTGALTISGSGAMWDWDDPADESAEYIAPWIMYEYYDSIKSVTINDGITALGDYTFAYCESLTGVSIPNTVKEIGEGAFYDCLSLKSIALPNSVTTIYDFAFTACESLKNITVPAGVTALAGSAFAGCTAADRIQVASGNSQYKSVDGVVFSKDGATLMVYPAGKKDHIYKVPSGTERIGEMAFFFNMNLRAVSLPDGVTDIGEGAFAYAEKLLRIYIPASMVNIREAAFSECSALADVYYAWEDGGRAMMNMSYTDNDPLHHAEWHYYMTAEEMLTALFEDISKEEYYYQAVNWAARTGVTSGKSDITFCPNDTCTRGQAVTFLWRASGSEKVSGISNPFTDVKKDDYFYNAVLWAVKNGVTKGVTATTFGPNEKCNRGQIVTFLWRAEKEPEASTAVLFEDVGEKDYFYKAVQWAVERGVTKGVTNETFVPAGECTRGQIVTFLYRAQKKYTVTFNANGGDSVSPAGILLTNGEIYGTLPVPVRGGYMFSGWYTEAGGGTEVTNLTVADLTADQTIYAHWKPASYYVYFKGNGGSVSPDRKTVTNEGSYGEMPAATRDGYAFAGWFTEAEGGTEITDSMTVNLTQSQTLYAHWTVAGTITDSWEEIIASINDGTYKSKYKIGDTKELDLGSEGIVAMQIAAFDADELADGSGKAAVTWISRQLLSSDYPMNWNMMEDDPSDSSKHVEGTGSIGGWKHSAMRAWLKSDILPLLPSEVQNAVRPVIKYSASFDAYENLIQNETTVDELWIPSYRETGLERENIETEGPEYSGLFASDKALVKEKNGKAAAWWLRSVYDYSGHFFWQVYGSGSIDYYHATSPAGTVIGFCM